MKRLLSIILVLAFCASMLCIPASAITDGDWEFNLKNGEAHITKYVGSGGEVVVPTTLKGATVTRLCFGAFTDNKNATSIHVPSTVKVIENMAFQGCVAESIYIEDGVTEIANMAFRLNDSLKTIRIPGTVTTMGFELVSGCKSLENAVLEEGISFIPREMFTGCTALKQIKIPSTVTRIEYYAFGDTGLESVTIPANVVEIGEFVFERCSSLTNVNFAGTKLELIDTAAFHSCTALENICIPVSVKELGSHLFWNCTSLKGVVVPYGCTKIGNNLFWDVGESVEWVSIPSTVTSFLTGLIGEAPNLIVYCPAGSEAEKCCQKTTWDQSYITDASADSGIQVLYNGIRISFGPYGQNPEVINSRTMVPLRSIFEAMGAEIQWDNATKTVTATRGDVTISLAVGSNTMYVNGEARTLDTPACIINGRTMVPTRAIAEAFQAGVQWIGTGRTVLITE